jgi:DNA-binding NarL/FixJ family response regulator
MEKTVLVVDDHPLFRSALVGLIEEGSSIATIAASTAEEGLQRVRETNVDVVLLDLGLPGVSSVDAVALFRRACTAEIIVVTASERRHEIAAAVKAGAAVIVSKSLSSQKLREVIDQVLDSSFSSDNKWICPAGAISLAEESNVVLTGRQQEVAALLVNGYSNREIGSRLGLAEITIKTHLTGIFRMLGVVNRTQAVGALPRLGIVMDQSVTSQTVARGVQLP